MKTAHAKGHRALERGPAGDARQAIVEIVSAAVAEMHADARLARPDWFRHLLHKAEVKAARIADEAARSPYSNGAATFCEVFAKNLPALFTAALERLDSPEEVTR